nr:hypothetical protein GCM10025732_37020 [Glycomyces mayteni]
MQRTEGDGGDHRALDAAQAARDDHEERVHEVGLPGRGAGGPDERQGDARDPGEARADEERRGVHGPRGDPRGLGEVPVAHDGADAPPGGREPQDQGDGGDRQDRQRHDEQAGLGDGDAEEVDAAAQGLGDGHVHRGRPEDVAGGLLEDEADAEGDQERVERPVVEAPQEQRLQDQAHGAADEEADGEGDQEEAPASPTICCTT